MWRESVRAALPAGCCGAGDGGWPGPGASGRRCEQVAHADQVEGRHAESERPAHSVFSSDLDLPHAGGRFEPAEGMLDSLAQDLAELIARMPRRASIDCALALRGVLSDVRRDSQLPHARDEVCC